MGNPFSKFGVSDRDLAIAIRSSAEVDAGINKFMREQAIPYAKSISPVDDGDYAASWEVMVPARNGRGVFGPKVWYAHIVEFGSGPDKRIRKPPRKGLKTGVRAVRTGDDQYRTVGPNTPTKAMGIAQKVAEHFGGSLKGGIDEVVIDVV